MAQDHKITYQTVVLWTFKHSKPDVEPQYCSAQMTLRGEPLDEVVFTGPNCKVEMADWVDNWNVVVDMVMSDAYKKFNSDEV